MSKPDPGSLRDRITKHTQGPWRIIDGFKIVGPHPKDPENRICRVADALADVGTFLSKQRANAKLIAAAPDLLDALEAALPYVENDALEQGCQPDADETVIKVRAAIAKARGDT